ncbi:MAG: NAD(P)/FAD-dependent oxidoreductase [Polyangiales bacterium]
MHHDHDLVIVGGGPAGISTALHLQRAAPALAERTVVLEKKRYPRDKYCAGAVAARGLRILDELGVRPEVPSVPFDTMSLRLPQCERTVRDEELGVVVRRLAFDEALARSAMERGIDVRQDTPVRAVEVRDDGVRVHTGGGVITAKAVVGADGVSGVVRRTAGGFEAPTLRAQVVEVDTEPLDDDPERSTLLFDLSRHDLAGYIWDFPTLVDGEEKWCRGVYAITTLGPDGVRRRLEAYLRDKGLDPSRYRYKQFAERGFRPDTAISRPRVLLVGEAAGIDIATGEGIAQALEYGELAGPFLSRAFEQGDLGFSQWLDHVRSSTAGRRMRLRHAAYRMYFGPERTAAERFLGASPEVVRLCSRHFAGLPQRPSTLARVLGGWSLPMALHAPSALLRSATGRDVLAPIARVDDD